jgi:hypothetical protein
MDQSSAADVNQVVETMISLTRLSTLRSAIVAGDNSMDLCLLLRRRGFLRIATPATCRTPKKQHDVGFLMSPTSLAVTETALSQMSQYLSEAAMISVLISARETGFSMGVRKKLEQLGFRIEVGVHCRQGLVLSACRCRSIPMKNAA